MIAYFYKSYSDGDFEFFNFNLKENEEELLNLSGLPLPINYTDTDIINKANEISSQFENYTLDKIFIDNGDTTFNWLR